jgi:hypothetical protein
LQFEASLTNSSRDPISKRPFTKRTGGVAQGVGPEFKLQYCKKKDNNNVVLGMI